jgi:hypothetical protein
MTDLREAIARALDPAAWAYEDQDRHDMAVRREQSLDHADAALAAIEAAGWQCVPKEPTVEMCKVVDDMDWASPVDLLWSDGYKAMLAAAPKP